MADNIIAYIGIVVIGVVGVIIVLLTLEGIWRFLKVREMDKNVSGKYDIYECGEIAVGNPKFFNISFKYYIYALMFVVFDIETVFLFPWAVEFTDLGVMGFIEAMLFIALILLALIYAISKKFLKWTD